MMCIELMEIGARDRTYGASIVIEFSTGGEGRGEGRKQVEMVNKTVL